MVQQMTSKLTSSTAAVRTVRNLRTGELVVHKIVVADNWLRRLRGLLGTSTLPRGSGLLLAPCRAVHTIGMRYSIDVVFLDRHNRIRKTITQVAPFRLCAAHRHTCSVLELPSGTVRRSGLRIGDKLEFEEEQMMAASGSAG